MSRKDGVNITWNMLDGDSGMATLGQIGEVDERMMKGITVEDQIGKVLESEPWEESWVSWWSVLSVSSLSPSIFQVT